jgi:hypothetical protein
MSCTVTRSVLRRSFAAVSILLVSSVVCLAGKHFVMPVAQPAKTYPAHDEHSGESVTLGLDPYDLPDKASIFSVHYSDVGLMPIFVVITNDGDQTVALSGMKAELVTVNRTKIPPATQDDIYRRISRPTGTISPNPLPWPKKAKGSISKDAMDEIQNTQFAAKAVEPHGTQSGFMFFDVSDVANPLAGAHFYLTRVRDAKGNELMYFEVPLEKYLSAPEKQK